MANLNLKNNAYSALAAGISNIDTSLTVTTGQGDRFPAVSSPAYFKITLQDASNNIEIVKVTNRTGGSDSMTIVRAQEGTTARSWSLGDAVELRVTAGILAPLELLDEAATIADFRTAINVPARTGSTLIGDTASDTMTVESTSTFNGPVTLSAALTANATGNKLTVSGTGSTFVVAPASAGTLDNVAIGGSTPAAGTFTSILGTTAGLTGNLSITKTGPQITLSDNEDANSSDFKILNTYVTSETESNLRILNGSDVRLAMKPDGTLMLGTTSDSGFAGGDQRIILNGTSNVRFEIGINGSQEAGIFANGTQYIFYTSVATPLSFQVNGTSRLEVDATGATKPAADNTYSCGTAFNRWSVVYAATGTINTSDERLKTKSGEVLGLDFISELEPFAYTWKEAGKKLIEKTKDGKGKYKTIQGKRTHWGLKAQQVKKVTDKYGVDFAGWVMSDPSDPKSTQGLRYDQFIAPLIKSVQEQQEQFQAIIKRIETLEAA